MKFTYIISILAFPLIAFADEGNELIDYRGFQKLSEDVRQIREERRISEEKFLEMAKEDGTVILDTRSKSKFDKRHIKGAIHLNFSDFTEESLAKIIPEKTTRILIYCNNNFKGDQISMPSKRAEIALNVPTFINLHGYGYGNVYELKPLLDVETTKIPFEGSLVLPENGN